MQIDRIYYPVETLGYGKRIGIWTIGCHWHCYNCSNPELWNERSEKDIPLHRIIECVEMVEGADGITITGGDPFYQLDELKRLVVALNELGYEDILLYTGYKMEELYSLGSQVKDVLDRIGVLIDGRYVDELNDNRSIRGSSNQRIFILNPKLGDRYKDVELWARKTQIVMSGDNDIMAVGIPMKGYE